jgi:hypothetical protein
MAAVAKLRLTNPTYARLQAAGVEFVSAPRSEAYGQVAVFIDIAGNRWDLLGPRLLKAP